MSRRIGQVAVCVTDYRRSCNFYRQVLGLDHIFGTTSFRGEMAETIQGMPNAASVTQWLIDGRQRFQLEVFQFEQPESAPLRENSSITDIGYNRVIFAVRSVSETRQLAEASGSAVHLMTSPDDADRAHAWLKDPDGILVELVEWPEKICDNRSAQLIGLGISTADLDLSVEDMCEGFGFELCPDVLEHARYWSEQGRLQKQQTLQLDDMYLVASQYSDARPRPLDYQLADIGIMNFAIFFRDQADFAACIDATQGLGMQPNCEPLSVAGNASIVYQNDRQGFSVEMIYMVQKLWGLYGFQPPTVIDRAINWLAQCKAHWAYRGVAVAESGGNSNPFSYRVATPLYGELNEALKREVEEMVTGDVPPVSSQQIKP